MTARTAPTPPAICLFFGSMSLSMRIKAKQRQEGNHRDDRAKLVLEEELETVFLARRVMLVGILPHQVAGNGKNRNGNQ